MGRDCAMEEGLGGHTPEQFVSQHECSLDASTSMCRSATARGEVQVGDELAG